MKKSIDIIRGHEIEDMISRIENSLLSHDDERDGEIRAAVDAILDRGYHSYGSSLLIDVLLTIETRISTTIADDVATTIVNALIQRRQGDNIDDLVDFLTVSARDLRSRDRDDAAIMLIIRAARIIAGADGNNQSDADRVIRLLIQ